MNRQRTPSRLYPGERSTGHACDDRRETGLELSGVAFEIRKKQNGCVEAMLCHTKCSGYDFAVCRLVR